MNIKEIIEKERALYLGSDEKNAREMQKRHHKRYTIWRYLYYFRMCQYWRGRRSDKSLGPIGRRVAKYKARYYDKKRNIYSGKSGVEIGIESVVGVNCDIWHSGVVINGTVGDNCTFHGNNVVGMKSSGNRAGTPVLGNGVDLGVGSVVIGQVNVADDCVIGANAVVTKDFNVPGSVIVGIPGKIINKEKK